MYLFSFDLEKSLEMKLGNIQLLFMRNLKQLINKTLHFHYLIAKLCRNKYINEQLNSFIFFLNCHSYKKNE